MKRITYEEAIDLSLEKWERHVKAGGIDVSVFDDKKFKYLLAYCGFCDFHDGFCRKCEFGAKAGDCGMRSSLNGIWVNSKTKKNAQNILDVISEIKNGK